MKPIRSLEPIWQRIERDGYWVSSSGNWSNWQWTAESAYPLLGITEEENKSIAHVASGAFGMDLRTEIGRNILSEFYRLAQNGSFHGPWRNYEGEAHSSREVEGHRHDQTALSVIAHRLGCVLTKFPDPMAYAGCEDERTILVADGSY